MGEQHQRAQGRSGERFRSLAARCDPSQAALIVVDAQNDFCHADGVLGRRGSDTSRCDEPLRRLAALTGEARAAGMPVIFVRNTHASATDSAEWLARSMAPDAAPTCEEGSWGAEFCRLAPAPSDHVVVKHRYSAFARTRLEELLRGLGRPSLLFTGFTTGVCVESSLRDAVCHDFVATLVEDCCGDYSEEAHRRSVEIVAERFGAVASSDEVRAAWSRAAGGTPAAPQPPAGASV